MYSDKEIYAKYMQMMSKNDMFNTAICCACRIGRTIGHIYLLFDLLYISGNEICQWREGVYVCMYAQMMHHFHMINQKSIMDWIIRTVN